MASGTANPNYDSVLVANTVDTVTLPANTSERWIVENVDGVSRIDFTTDGTTPVVGGGAGTGRVLPAAVGAQEVVAIPYASGGSIKLISAGTPHYAIEVVEASESES